MNIWIEMAKYRVTSEEFFYEIGSDLTDRKYINIDVTPSSEYKTFFTFVPKLSGKILLIVEYSGSGTSINMLLKENDMIINELKNDGYFGEVNIKAFNKYTLEFKNDAIEGVASRVPKRVALDYGIRRSISQDMVVLT